MKIETRALRSRVAKRMFGLFALSALVPIAVVALLSYSELTERLTQQSESRLRDAAKNYGMAILGRLQSVDRHLEEIAAQIRTGAPGIVGELQIRHGMADTPVLIRPAWPFSMEETPRILAHLQSGRGVLSYRLQANSVEQFLLSRLIDPELASDGIIVATIEPSYLWGDLEALPESIDFCVAHDRERLFCSDGQSASGAEAAGRGLSPSTPADEQPGHRYLSNDWFLFLEPQFGASGLTITARQPEEYALAPVAAFRSVFPLAIVLTIIMALLLSIRQIRTSLGPLEKLIGATRKISKGEFSTAVQIESGDEFEELGRSLNAMATKLGRQFGALVTLSEMDRLILSSRDVEPVLEMLLSRMTALFACDCAGIAIVDADAEEMARTYYKDRTKGEPAIARVRFSPADIEQLKRCPMGFTVTAETHEASHLSPLFKLGARGFFVLPVIRKERLSGVIYLGYGSLAALREKELSQSRDFADRLAVALSAAEREERLYNQAHYDALTNLPNRQLLKERLAMEIRHAKRQNTQLALLYVDLDHFKNVNDTRGHSVGDRLLQEAAIRLTSCVRDTDTVARLGGDEFAIILSNIDKHGAASAVAGEAIRSLSAPFAIGGFEHFMSASIGITVFPTDGSSVEEFLMKADTAMYRAKAGGRGIYEFYRHEMNAEALQRIELEAQLRRAVQEREFELHYQPKVNVVSGTIVGVEALLRWKHPEKGIISPVSFIDVAEESGLIVPIGEWVLETACLQYAEWQESGILLEDIAVNVSARQLKDHGFVRSIRQILKQTGISPAALELEITENILIEDILGAVTLLDEIHELGVHLAIDDFGTGYSSMRYLQKLPIDTLKIDRSFIIDISVQSGPKAITSAIVQMAHTLRKRVVAEGVEHPEQLTLLRSLGCEYAQGYLFGHPLEADEFAELARRGSQPRQHAS